MRLRMLSRVVTRVYDEALRPAGVKASQVNILVAAWKLGVAQPGKVCELLDLDPSTLSRNVERLRARGWVETVAGGDARQQPFRLTRSGRGLLERVLPRWEVAQREARRILGVGVAEALGKTVKRVRRRQQTGEKA